MPGEIPWSSSGEWKCFLAYRDGPLILGLLSRRGVFDRQDSFRSDYLSDRDSRYGMVQQASIDSTDSRLCYLTSSEVSPGDPLDESLS